MVDYKCINKKKQTISGSTQYLAKIYIYFFFLNLGSQLQHVTNFRDHQNLKAL